MILCSCFLFFECKVLSQVILIRVGRFGDGRINLSDFVEQRWRRTIVNNTGSRVMCCCFEPLVKFMVMEVWCVF